jgi:hypothetical protein
MRVAVVIAGVVGALLGFGAARLVSDTSSDGAGRRESAGGGATPDFAPLLARLDAIDGRVAQLAARAPEPARTADPTGSRSDVDARLAAIETALTRLADAEQKGAPELPDAPPRRPKEIAAIDRLYLAEDAKRQIRRDDHLGYTPGRLYERYGAPDSINDEADQQKWMYADTTGKRGVIFYLRKGVVVNEDPWRQ